MEQADPKWYLFGVIALILVAIIVPRWFRGRAYSDKEAHQACSEVYLKYVSLVESSASNEDWASLEADALPRLDAIAADHEANLDKKTPASTTIYQIAKYELPRVIQEKGSPTDKRRPGAIANELAAAERIILAPPEPEKPKKSKPGTGQGWDPFVFAILFVDGAVVIVGIGCWCWRK